MPNTKKGELNSAEKKITLSGLLSVVDPETQTLIIHHMGADCYEAVATGPVREAQVAPLRGGLRRPTRPRRSPLTRTTGPTPRPPS